MAAMSTAGEGAAFCVAPYLREIGRGKKGARGLTQADAAELMSAILTGRVDGVSLGGVLIALRMKGEAPDEIAGFLEALDPLMSRAPARAPAWVVFPSYNGARSMPNLLPLLALLLARSGLPVLVHGQESEPATVVRRRVTSSEIFKRLGVPACPTMAAAGERADAGLPALVELAIFAPALARLIALRPVLGVRNVAHSLVKLLRPVEGPSLLVSSYTHPEFGRLHGELFERLRMFAMNLRGTDGESVVSARRAQAIDLWQDGKCREVVARREVAPAETDLPEPDAASTAAWTAAVLDGRHPVPQALQEQIAAIAAALRGTGAAGAR
jgi:anthranilate phosphoribosyltransferase